MPLFSRLALGTAQWGMDYGILGGPRMVENEIQKILAEAAGLGVELLDTAPAYGQSESLVGRLLRGTPIKDVVTKVSVDAVSPDDVERSCRNSMSRLNVPRLYGLLFHRTEHLRGHCGHEMWKRLEVLKSHGDLTRLGVSIYDVLELERLLDLFPIDLVQLPLNVFDQRMAASGVLKKLKDLGVEIHARSVFLQGILLQAPQKLPSPLIHLEPYVSAFRERASEVGLTPLQAALSFVINCPEVDRVVVGIDSLIHFREIAQVMKGTRSFEAQGLEVIETSLIDPRQWRTPSM